jgi:signal transduction histidine kinase
VRAAIAAYVESVSTSAADRPAAAGVPAEHAPLTRRELALIVAFWLMYASLNLANRVFDEGGPRAHSAWGAVVLAFAEPLIWIGLTPAIFALVGRLGGERTSRSSRTLRIVAIALGGVAVALLMGWVGSALRGALSDMGPPRDDPMRHMLDSMRFGGGRGGRPRRGGPSIWFGFVNGLIMYLGVVAAALARAFSLRYRARREQATRLETQLAEARLDALRRQLDPHFLFNTLNAVSALVERDPRGVRRMIARLSDLLRHSFEGSSDAEVPLRQELALLGKYVDIMQVRFQGRLTVETHVDEPTLAALVPGLILQPLVENAIRHGVERMTQPGRIDIEATIDGDPSTGSGQAMLVLRVRDDGPGPVALPDMGVRPDGQRTGVGLRNTVARLEQLYGTRQRFTLAPGPTGGTVAEIRLPYHARTAAPNDALAREIARAG